jgi:thiol:disulfide interchange protein DsbD
VDFTADWCITCKFNERTAIDTPTVRALLAEKQIVPMKADWTNANPEITAALKSFGRVGVPFYVIYPAGKSTSPVALPELLTETILVNALNASAPSTGSTKRLPARLGTTRPGDSFPAGTAEADPWP